MFQPMESGKIPTRPAVNVRLSTADYLLLAGLAQADGTTLSGYVRTLVRRHLSLGEAASSPTGRADSTPGAP